MPYVIQHVHGMCCATATYGGVELTVMPAHDGFFVASHRVRFRHEVGGGRLFASLAEVRREYPVFARLRLDDLLARD